MVRILRCGLLSLFLCIQATLADEILVTSTADHGPGTLRGAIEQANRTGVPTTIRFDTPDGLFSVPRTITLDSELSPITGELVIDGYIEGRLWQASGVTLDGQGKQRIFHVREGARVEIRYLTLKNGRAERGGGVLSNGDVVLYGVTLWGNQASLGGALAVDGGKAAVVNSTFYRNKAKAGGGVSILEGSAGITHATFTENEADSGGAVYNEGTLVLRNSILANGIGGEDCVSRESPLGGNSHNIIERDAGCGGVLTTENPRLGRIGYFNGPTQTIPLSGRSPAINRADNAASVDQVGDTLTWDQRGNGDPRFAAGIADIGAFEQQAVVILEVDTPEDADMRWCTRAVRDCSLRGAMALASASTRHNQVTFDRAVFTEHRKIQPARPLPPVSGSLRLVAGPGLQVVIGGPYRHIEVPEGAELELENVSLSP